jgi:hypothetical protein
LHHRAFDSGLLAILPDYRIAINRVLLSELRKNNLSAGEDRCFKRIRPQILLPPEKNQRPTNKILEIARNARGLDMNQLEVVV